MAEEKRKKLGLRSQCSDTMLNMEDRFIDREVIDLYTRVAKEYKERVYTEELIIYQSRGFWEYSNTLNKISNKFQAVIRTGPYDIYSYICCIYHAMSFRTST